MKAYNDHVERNGQPASHAKAKEIMYVPMFVSLPLHACDPGRLGLDLLELSSLAWLRPKA